MAQCRNSYRSPSPLWLDDITVSKRQRTLVDDEEDEAISEDGSDFSQGEEVEDEEDESDSVSQEDDDDKSIYKRVICLLNDGDVLEALHLKECKVYLWKHGLRLAGTKAVCIERIKEHWRIKDGNGEALYPRSSFVINCTGDFCKGVVVLFMQTVYEKFDKVTRYGTLLGKRTIAGRVVKESYGSAKQQHTFTVEVMWSKGIKKLPSLYPLLVKGRNLCKLKTSRQGEKMKVLTEEHKRGTAARLTRAMKKSKKIKSASGDMHYVSNFCSSGALTMYVTLILASPKCQKYSYHARSSQMKETSELKKRKRLNGRKEDTLQQHANNHRQEAPPPRQLKCNRSDGIKLLGGIRNRSVEMGPTLLSYANTAQDFYLSQRELHHCSVPFHFSSYDVGYAPPMMRFPPFRPYTQSIIMPES